MENENIELVNEKEALVRIDPGIYEKEIIYGAAYNFLDKAYFFLSGDPQKEIRIRIKIKGEEDPEEMAQTFLNELISVGLRIKLAEKNKALRDYYLAYSLLGVSKKDMVEELDSTEKDPLGIAVPWEEKNKQEKDED